MARTKADIQTDLDELTTALRPHLENLADIMATADAAHNADLQAKLTEELAEGVRALIGEAYGTTSRSELFSLDRVRGTEDTYRDLAVEVANS